ncbi:kinase-like domain-containing protein [Mycena crocata]|nr:kinase-like domain-containing protein [Mycena crocata]
MNPDDSEHIWVDMQPFLLSVGYRLRPRYDPDWIPSWKGKKIGEYEDSLGLYIYCNMVDAIRIEDGKKVVLKRVETASTELAIIKYLSEIRDPRNHTIPLFDILAVPPDNSFSLLVMPNARVFNHPPFHCRSEFVEAMRQYLEGLELMHEHNICHFDIAPQNLLMDESHVVPAGSHFCSPKSHTGFPGVFSWENRCSVSPVAYYYIDFGLSMYFPNGKEAALTTATLRTFKTIPELSLTVPYNPFKVDIFQLGLMMHNLIKKYPALSAFRPVAVRMMSPKPEDRPDPAESLSQFNNVVARISSKKLGAPIVEKQGLFLYCVRKVITVCRKNYPPSRRYENLGYGW